MGWFLFFSAIVVIIFIGIKYKNLKSENEKIIVKTNGTNYQDDTVIFELFIKNNENKPISCSSFKLN